MIQFILECIFRLFGELVIEYFFTKYKKWAWWLWGVSTVISGILLVQYTNLIWWQHLLFSPIIGIFATILLILPVHLGLKLKSNATKNKVKKR